MATRKELEKRIGERETAGMLRHPLASLLIRKGLIEESELIDATYAAAAEAESEARRPPSTEESVGPSPTT